MQTPDFLTYNSKIAIISPAGAINPIFIEDTINYIKKNDFSPIVFPNAKNKYYQFAGTDIERLNDIQLAFDDDNIKAIICSRGGYGLIKILDKIDLSKFIQNPKWIIGFSDITNLHLLANKFKIKSIHGQMAKAISQNTDSLAITNIFNILKSNIPTICAENHVFNKFGNVNAEIIGGNLSIIYSLQGTKYEIDTTNKILFIEDLNEYLYNIDRMLHSLQLANKLQNIKALIVGAFTDMKDNDNPFGMNAYEIILNHVKQYNYPICFNFPIGHIDNNQPIVCGHNYNLNINEQGCTLTPLNK